MSRWTRRRLLEASGAALLAAPILALQERLARGQNPSPPRIIVVFSPNGPVLAKGPVDERGGAPSASSFKLHPFWAPLEQARAQGLFINNVQHAGRAAGELSEGGHASGGWCSLTGTSDKNTKLATGPSFDVFVGRALKEKNILTPRQNLLVGLHDDAGGWGPWWEEAGKPVRPIARPADVFGDLRATFGNDRASARTPLLSDKSLLDALARDCGDFSNALGKEGKDHLLAHCEGLRAVESGLTAQLAAVDKGTCRLPQALPAGYEGGVAQLDAQINAWATNIALALACEFTRVVGFSFGSTAARFALPGSYGVPESTAVDSGDSGAQHHAWTHRYDGTPEKEQALRTFYNWYSKSVMTLWRTLGETMDAAGRPLTESTVLLWVSELGGWDGGNEPHACDNVPVVLLGSPGGRAQLNRPLDFKNNIALMHQLYVSLAHHMGLDDVVQFGQIGPEGRGPLSML